MSCKLTEHRQILKTCLTPIYPVSHSIDNQALPARGSESKGATGHFRLVINVVIIDKGLKYTGSEERRLWSGYRGEYSPI